MGSEMCIRDSADSTYQFYDVRDLWGHMLVAQQAGLSLVHCATEPVSASEVARAAFGVHYDHHERPLVHYDLRTQYAEQVAGRTGPYLRSRAEILAAIRTWAAPEISGSVS